MIMKNVLLLGDSVRMQYQPYVAEQLSDMSVSAPDENCRFSSYMLNSLRFWLPSMPKPDIIHFNSGLWDTAILYVDDGPFTPINDYVKNMNSILRELKKFDVPIIFATSTPVKAEIISAVATPSVNDPEAPTVFKQNNDRIAQYNAAVTESFKDQGVIINDLFSLVYLKLDEYICNDGIHMNDAGIRACGDAVVNAINSTIL